MGWLANRAVRALTSGEAAPALIAFRLSPTFSPTKRPSGAARQAKRWARARRRGFCSY